MKRDITFTVDKRKLIIGAALVVLGILVPAFFSYGISGIGYYIQASAAAGQSSFLLIAALKLVILNSVRSFPHYLGTFLIVKAIRCENREINLLKTFVLSAVIILGVYYAIEQIYDIRYNFAVPALLMLSVILAVDRLDFTMVSITKEILMLAMLILAIQFLDPMPALPSALFGRGEISSYIKNLAELMGAAGFLQKICMIFSGIFTFSAVILGMQISLENQLRKAKKEAEDERERLVETRTRLIDARTNKEQQFLVHDLKAPLTSIQIWNDLLRMQNSCGVDDINEARESGEPVNMETFHTRFKSCEEYLNNIDGSIAHMNMLISEIMNSKVRNIFPVRDVVRVFSSQTSPSHYNSILHTECVCGDVKIEVNRTNFVRALINLTENASHSIHHDHGEIKLFVSADEEYVSFSVSDNGEGIREEMLDKIWEEGVSGKNSSGVGLYFVKEVITEAGGNVSIDSKLGEGTTVTLRVPLWYE